MTKITTTIIGAATAALLFTSPARAQSSEPAQKAEPAASPAPVRLSLSSVLGTAFANKGLEYGVGVGVRPAVTLHNVYIGGMFAVHAGDTKDIKWGETAIAKGGKQHYSSTPVIAEADVGYRIELPIGPVKTALTPFVTAGLLVVAMSSSGDYGDSSTTDKHALIGGGAAYEVDFGDHLFVGAMFRMHKGVAGDFEFGNEAAGTYQHGFKTSLWYGAAFTEVGWRF